MSSLLWPLFRYVMCFSGPVVLPLFYLAFLGVPIRCGSVASMGISVPFLLSCYHGYQYPSFGDQSHVGIGLKECCKTISVHRPPRNNSESLS